MSNLPNSLRIMKYLELPVYVLVMYLHRGVAEKNIEAIRAVHEPPDTAPTGYFIWRKGAYTVDLWKFNRPDESWLCEEMPLEQIPL